MLQTKNICRICSSRGDYDIFSVIPAYLHASSNEFLHWKKDISKLLEETTGLTVDPNDGLPQKICALCISYLKHAATFRQQAIDNILSLKAAQVVINNTKGCFDSYHNASNINNNHNNVVNYNNNSNNNDSNNCMNTNNNLNNNISKNINNNNHNNSNAGDKEEICIRSEDLIFSETRKTDTNTLINNILSNNAKNDDYSKKFLSLNVDNASTPTRLHKRNDKNNGQHESNNLKTYLNLLFDKELNYSSDGHLGASRKATAAAVTTSQSITAAGSAKFRNKNRRNEQQRQQPQIKSKKLIDLENDADEDDFQKMRINGNYENCFGMLKENIDPTAYDDFQTASSDDNEAYEEKLNIFGYKEKNFEEDDIMDLDVFKDSNIVINIPEHCKERKCRACYRRFMFEDSYKEHMEICVEYKFLVLIEELNRLLEIRRSKAVSPHEFIRRVIFCLKKVCKWLSLSCGENLLPDLIINGDPKRRTKSDCKSSGAENSSGDNRTMVLKKINNNFTEQMIMFGKNTDNSNSNGSSNDSGDTTIVINERKIGKSSSLLDILREKADPTMIKNFDNRSTASNRNTPEDPLLERLRTGTTPIPTQQHVKMKLDSFSSDSSLTYSSSAEQNIKTNKNSSMKPLEFPQPPKIIPMSGSNAFIESYNRSVLENDSNSTIIQNSTLIPASQKIARPLALPAFNQQVLSQQGTENQQKSYQNHQQQKIIGNPSPLGFPTFYSKPTFSARCNACSTVFESIASLEEHNAKFHNDPSKIEERKRIIALFEGGEDGPQNLEGSVDVINCIQNSEPIKFIKSPSATTTADGTPANNHFLNKQSNIPSERNTMRNSCNDHKNNSMKAVKCQKCDEKFMTIFHLDMHKLKKCHLNQKSSA